MTRSSKFTIYHLGILTVICLLLAAPFISLIPTSIFLNFASLDSFHIGRNLTAKDQEAILAIIKKGESDVDALHEVPPFISLKSYLFYYRKIGILSVEAISSDQCGAKAIACIKVYTGFACNGWCGGGNIYFISGNGKSWYLASSGHWTE